MPSYRNSNSAFIYLASDPSLGPGPWPQWGLLARAWARPGPGLGPGPGQPPLRPWAWAEPGVHRHIYKHVIWITIKEHFEWCCVSIKMRLRAWAEPGVHRQIYKHVIWIKEHFEWCCVSMKNSVENALSSIKLSRLYIWLRARTKMPTEMSTVGN